MRIASLRAGLGLLLVGATLAFTSCETPEIGPKSGKSGKGGCGSGSGSGTPTTTSGGAS